MAHEEHLDPVYVTFHGTKMGAPFNTLDKAYRYPGPRGYECSTKAILVYAPLGAFANLVKEWKQRASGIEGDGPRMELEAAIYDLQDLITKFDKRVDF